MFKQFTENINNHQVYLLLSLGIFFVFFVVVAVMLVRIRKQHIEHMQNLPLQDSIDPKSLNQHRI